MQYNKLLFTGIFILLVNIVFAQDSLNVSQVEKAMSHGTQSGFTVDIPQAKLKDVVNAWKKYIKRGETKASVENIENEYQINGTALTNISAQPMNVYTTIKEAENVIRITSFFTEDDSNYISISLNAEKAAATEKLMKDFARMQYRLAVENELNDETKNLENL